MPFFDLYRLRLTEFVSPVLLLPTPLATTALAVNPSLLPVPVAGPARLERKKAVEPLVPLAPFAAHRSWTFVPVVHPLLASFLSLQEAQKRVLEKTLHMFYSIRRPLDVAPLAALLRVLLRLL